MSATAETASARLAELLRNARFEVLPLEGIEEQVLEHLGADVKLTVTASPRRGLDATLELTERFTAAGYVTVPHISARLVRDRELIRKAREWAQRLMDERDELIDPLRHQATWIDENHRGFA